MRTLAEDYALPWGEPYTYTIPEQNAIELACVDRDLADWLEDYESEPGRRAMVSTIKAARRYIERAHHAIHAAMLIEKGGDFTQCQEDACGHLEVTEIPPEQFYPVFVGEEMVEAHVMEPHAAHCAISGASLRFTDDDLSPWYANHARTCQMNTGVGDGKDACDCSARSRDFGWADHDGEPLKDPERSDLRAAIERDSIDEAEEQLEGRPFVPMFGRLQ